MKNDRLVIAACAILLVVVAVLGLWLLGSGEPPQKIALLPPAAQTAPTQPKSPTPPETARPPRVAAPVAPSVAVTNEAPASVAAAPSNPPPADTAVDPAVLLEQKRAITNNLRQLGAAAAQYMLDKGATSANFYDLVGPQNDSYIRSINSVAGENYDTLVIRQTDSYLEVTTTSGMVVRYNL